MSATETLGAVGRQTQTLLTQFFGEASPATVFSQPEQVGEDVVITAAAWDRVGGFGWGAGGGEADDGGGGGGGGGVSEGRPVAVIRLTPHGTEVTVTPDVTKITVTMLMAAVGVWRALRAGSQ